MPRSRITHVFLCALFGLTCAGAGAQSKIEFWHGFSGLRAEALQRLARDFNDSQKTYQVVTAFKGATDTDVKALLVAQKSGKAPHLVQLDQVAASALAAQRTAYRPAQLVLQEAGQSMKPAAYLPGILDTSTDTLGRVMALPLGAASVAFFYNVDLLKKAGIVEDKEPQTWTDVRDWALKVVDEEAAACAFSVDRITWVMVENLMSLHGQPYTEITGPFSHVSSVSFSNRLLARHIGMLSSWAKSGMFSYFGPREEAGERFSAGECAMLAGSSALYPALHAALGPRLRMSALPIHEDIPAQGARTLPSGNSIWVLAGKQPREYRGVGLFLAYLSRPEVQARWHQSTGDIPLTREAHEMSRKAGFYERNAWAEIPIRSTRSTARAQPRLQQLPHIGKIREILDQELEAVWAQSRTPTEALEAASERGTKLLRGK